MNPTMTQTDYPLEEKRRYEREVCPAIAVEFDGKAFVSTSWSMGGFLIDGYKGQLSSGSLFTISGVGSTAKDLIPVNVRARVVRVDRDTREFVVSFLDLDSPSYNFLQGLMTKRSSEVD
ncbi:MAG: hypothetical protein OEY85_09245 [Rhodospirillales bacterium]|nr:hypothetical protein [Rhodospirillales bacterium]